MRGAVVAAGIAIAMSGTASAAEPKCGLSNGKAASGAPIEIGAVVGRTGPADFSGSAQAAAAFFKCVNANGGINGRPVHYDVEDDQWNPETASQVAAKLVNDTKVVGMVGSSSFVECAATPSSTRPTMFSRSPASAFRVTASTRRTSRRPMAVRA